MTYQEIFDNIRNDTVTFISQKSEENGIDAGIIIEIMEEVISEIRYSTVVRALHEQREMNNFLTSKLQTFESSQPLENSADEDTE